MQSPACNGKRHRFCFMCAQIIGTKKRSINDNVKAIYCTAFNLTSNIFSANQYHIPTSICSTCYQNLLAYDAGRRSLRFARPALWQIPRNHITDCFFCLLKAKGSNNKTFRPEQESDTLAVTYPVNSNLPIWKKGFQPASSSCAQPELSVRGVPVSSYTRASAGSLSRINYAK